MIKLKYSKVERGHIECTITCSIFIFEVEIQIAWSIYTVGIKRPAGQHRIDAPCPQKMLDGPPHQASSSPVYLNKFPLCVFCLELSIIPTIPLALVSAVRVDFSVPYASAPRFPMSVWTQLFYLRYKHFVRGLVCGILPWVNNKRIQPLILCRYGLGVPMNEGLGRGIRSVPHWNEIPVKKISKKQHKRPPISPTYYYHSSQHSFSIDEE